MKEAFQNIADRELKQVAQYISNVQDYLSNDPELELEYSDALYILEMIQEKLYEKSPGKPLDFRVRDLGL
jgi:uncharacterized protein (DUF2164 family)